MNNITAYKVKGLMRLIIGIFLFAHVNTVVYAGEKPEIFAQLGHTSNINAIAVSPDGRFAISGGQDTIKLWDIATGKEIRTFTGHRNGARSVTISHDGKYILSGGWDNNLKLWDMATGKEIKTFKGHKLWVNSVAISPDGKYVLSGSQDKTIKLWNMETGEEIRTFKGFTLGVNSVAFSPDGKYILSGGNTLKLWDTNTGREIRTFVEKELEVPIYDVNSVAISPDGKYALSGNQDKTLSLWDIATGEEVRTFAGHTGRVNFVAFASDGRHVFSGSDDKTFKQWDFTSAKEVRTFSGTFKTVALSPDGMYALSANEDKTFRQCSLATGQEIKIFSGSASYVKTVAISPDGRSVLSGSDDKTVKIWDLENGREIRTLAGHLSVRSIALSPDGEIAFSGSDDGIIKLHDTKTGNEIRSFTGHSETVYSVAISPDGRFGLSASKDKQLKLWNIATGREIRTFTGHSDAVYSAAITSDGRYALSSSDNTLKLWDINTGREIKSFKGHGSNYWIISVAVSPDGMQAVSGAAVGFLGGDENTLKLWDIQTGQEIRSFKKNKGWVTSVAISADGKQVLSASENNLKLWNIETGREIRTFTGHTSAVYSVAFSPDGRHLLSGGFDGTTRLWSISTGKEIAQFIGFSDGEWIVVTPEGYYNSSLKGHEHLNIRMGNKVYGIDQFYDVFYRPDIVTAKLRGEDFMPLITLTIEDAIKNPPPNVNFTNVLSETSMSNVKVCYHAESAGGGIGEVRLFHNGKLIQSDGFYKDVAKTAGKIQLASLDSKSIREDMRSVVVKSKVDISPIASKTKSDIFKDCVVVDAVPGENEVSVSAFNKNNTVQSYMKTTGFKANIKAEDSHFYMLIVGIDQYNDKAVNLTYAVKDARDIKNKLLSQSATLYKPENIHAVVLTDKEATKANIQSQISMLAKKIKPADSFVLFVAGHGVLLQNQYFMLTHDFNGIMSDNSMISSNEIVEASKQIKSLSQLFIFDTCHAGGVDYIVSGLYDARMSVLAKKMGLHIYASASDKQAAMDGYKGNGLFTHALLDGLNNNREADKKRDGKVTVVGLGEYSKKMTTNISKEIGHSQTPLIINFGKDSQIYKLQ